MRARNKTVVMSKVENWIQKGSKYVELGDFKSAIEIFQKGLKDEPMTVKVGDIVLFGKYAGTELVVDNTDYLIMRESDILAIV